MSREFKQGERVFSILEGWGSVIEFKKRVMHPENDMREAFVIIRFDKDDSEMVLPEHTFALLQNEEYKLVPIRQEEKQGHDDFKDDPDRHFLMYTAADMAERLIQHGVVEVERDSTISGASVQISIGILEKVDKYLNSKRPGENN